MMKNKKNIFKLEVILFSVIIFLLLPSKKVFADIIAKQDQHNGQISGLLRTGSYNIQTLGSGLSGFLESVQLWTIRYGNPSTISVQILCYNESSYSTTCTNSSTSTTASISTSPSQITLTGFYYQLDPTKYYMIKANVNDATNQTIIYGVGSGNLWPNGHCWYPESCRTTAGDYYFILNSGIKITPTPTAIPTPNFVIVEQNQHAGEITYPFTGASDIQSLGTGLTGYVTSIKLYGESYSGSPTVTTQLLCYTDSGYTISCTNSEVSSSASLPDYMNTITTTLGYALNPSNYYILRVNISGGYGGFWGVGGFNIYPPGCFFWPWLSRTCSESDLYFRLESSPPSPTPTPSVSPTPAPFLDLPYDYKSKGKSFEQVALDPESWFDHAYPLADLSCCTQSIVRYDSFGTRVTDAYMDHNGYDYSEYRNGAAKNTSVLAAASGSATLILKNDSGGYGNLVKIDHPNGYQTWYGHLSNTGLLQLDQDGKKQVEKGEKIGEVGTTGNSTGYHIHFTVIKDVNADNNFEDDKKYGVVDPLGWKEKDDNGIKHQDPWEEWLANNNKTLVSSYNLFINREMPSEQQIKNDVGGKIDTDKVKITIPQNALPVNADIKIEKTAFDSSDTEGNILTSIVPSLILTAKSITGDLIKFFSLPLQITYDYSEADLTNILIDSIQLYFYNEESNKWEPLPTIIHDKMNKILTAQTSHFSRFALMGKAKDTIAPVTKITLNDIPESKKWYNNPVTIKLLPEDNHENSIGIADTFYSTNYTEDNNNWNDYISPIEFNNEGNYSLRYFSIDNGDNKEEQKTLNFGIDQTPPATTARIIGTKGNNDWYISDVSIELTASDEASGINSTKYSVDNGQTYQKYTNPIPIQTEGINKLLFYSEDNAGNKEDAKELEVKIDKTPPDTLLYTTGALGSEGWYRTNVRIAFNASDAHSGYKTTYYSLDEGNDKKFKEYTEIPPLILNQEEITKIYYYSVDNAGNKEDTRMREIKIDKTPPIVSISASPDSIWPPNGKMVDLKITGNSSDSHLKTTTFKVEDEYNQIQPPLSYFGQTIQLEAKRNGNDQDGRIYTIQATAEDLAGNTTPASTMVTVPHDQRK